MTAGTQGELKAALRDHDCSRVALAARQLWQAGERIAPEDLPSARECLEGVDDAALQVGLARAYIGSLDTAAAAAEARGLLQHASSHVVEAAYEALVDLGDGALDAVEGLAADRSRDIRWYAYEAAAHWQSERAIPLLIRGLHDEDFAIRWVASNGLIRIGPAVVVALLEALVGERPTLTFHTAARRIVARVSASGGLEEQLQRLVDALGRETTVYETPHVARDILHRLYGREL